MNGILTDEEREAVAKAAEKYPPGKAGQWGKTEVFVPSDGSAGELTPKTVHAAIHTWEEDG